jgi:REP element-mobilizing transposase RayT
MDIFRDNPDREVFLRFLGNALDKSEGKCYAWALMSNHYHLVVRTADRPLAHLMKPLNSKFAGYYNKRYHRRGYLFQDRFKSLASQDQGYIEEMIRYVHLNPVRAGVCKGLADLDKYKWTGHSVLLGNQKCAFQDVRTILLRFGKDTGNARLKYRYFIEEGLDNADKSAMDLIRRCTNSGQNASDPARWVIGDQIFVKRALENVKERQLQLARFAAEGWSLPQLSMMVAQKLGVAPELFLARTRSGLPSKGKKILAFLGNRQLDMSVAAIARFLSVSGSAVSRMIPQGELLARQHSISLNH